MRALVIIGVGVALTWPASAVAVDFRSACNTAALCAGVEAGGGRIIRCLKEHKSKVSTKCKTALGEFFLNQPIRSPKGGAGAGGAGEGGDQGQPTDAAGSGGGDQAPGR